MRRGRFYYTRTTSGNLLGEWSNETMNRNHTEGAVLLERFEGSDFIGRYHVCWWEGGEDNNVVTAILTINSRPDSTNIFTLAWTALNGNEMFTGEGFISNGILIGSYI